MNFTPEIVGNWAIFLDKEIGEMKKNYNILAIKKPTYPEIQNQLQNTAVLMTIVKNYLEGNIKGLLLKNSRVFETINIDFHKIAFTEIQIATEIELRKIIKENKYEILERENKISKIVSKLKTINNSNTVIKFVKKIAEDNVPKHPFFGDYLNTVLKNTPNLSKVFISKSKSFFDGISIIRNKLSHSKIELTDNEKERLIKSGFGKAISQEGGLSFRFDYYSILYPQVIKFLDQIYLNL